MEKSREAFRTISEVAEWLDVPTHVLRFWESRFSQIKPVKRAGGRRYYRPSDMRVIGGVKTLLHDQGMTIRGVQKLFREQGIKHVSSFSPKLYGPAGTPDEDDAQVIDGQLVADEVDQIQPSPAARSTRDATPDPVPEEETSVAEDAGPVASDPVFIHSRAAGQPVESEAPQPAFDLEPEPEPEQAAEPEAAPALSIPATPDVPDTDADDDDPAHSDAPGIAALVVTARRARLRGERDTIVQVVDRLEDLRARLG